MFLEIALLIAVNPLISDPISVAVKNYEDIHSYQVTLRSYGDGSKEIIRYYYKKPGFIKMEFIKPHKGAVLVYNPLKDKVKLRPFGLFKSFVLTMSPDSSLIKGSKDHKVKESDIGALLNMVKRFQKNGKTEIHGEDDLGEKKTIRVNVEGNSNFTVNSIHRYLLWLDLKTYLPLKVSAYSLDDELIEEVLMDDLEINIIFSEDFFKL